MHKAEIGVFGLGTMGGALALNLAEVGLPVAVCDRSAEQVARFMETAGDMAGRLQPAVPLADFVAALASPRTILLMIPAGAPVEAMVARLRPLLAPGDLIVDAGNADFNDTRRTEAALSGAGILFAGMGVSGGAEGARHGPSMMVGGPPAAWDRLRPMLEKIAARFRGDPCVDRVGPDGAGHFVKTAHNGIEYADMALIAELYGLLRDGAGWQAGRIGALFGEWSTGPLDSYLVEITARVLTTADPETGRPLVDVIRDSAGQKGTGRWTVIEALRLGQSASVIEAAVASRAWSAEPELRRLAAERLPAAAGGGPLPGTETLAAAFLAARFLAHAQGFRVLLAASEEYGWQLDPGRIAEIWRAGCIIRSALMNEIATAYRGDLPRGELVLSEAFRPALEPGIAALRETVSAAVLAGLPVPALSAALAWYDSLRRSRGTANLIQAQRDFFGAHGFERIDRPGVAHGPWASEGERA